MFKESQRVRLSVTFEGINEPNIACVALHGNSALDFLCFTRYRSFLHGNS